MKNKAIDVRGYKFSQTDKLLLDANIWMFLHGPASVSGSWPVRTYSAAFGSMLKAGAELFLDVLVLGEFMNRFARLEWKRLRPDIKDFKDFRRTTDFVPVAQAIANQASQIVSLCKAVDHNFGEWNLNGLLSDFSTGACDFNDQLLIETCRKHGLSLLTNDTDFVEGGLTVLTAHNRLLAACK